jgi:hypothetical protein
VTERDAFGNPIADDGPAAQPEVTGSDLLRLAPERADLQLARRGGGLDLLQLRADGGRSLVRTPGATGAPSKAIIFSQIDRAAPARLVRAAARRCTARPPPSTTWS